MTNEEIVVTPEQKMQKIVEAAGECWHEWIELPHTRSWDEFVAGEKAQFFCRHCSDELEETPISYDLTRYCQSSPTDLNELFRLAEKRGPNVTVSLKKGCMFLVRIQGLKQPIKAEEVTLAEALLNALYESLYKETQNA